MPLNETEFRVFKALVEESNRHNELECRNYLSHAIGLLLPQTPKDFVSIIEDRNFFGSTDYAAGSVGLVASSP